MGVQLYGPGDFFPGAQGLSLLVLHSSLASALVWVILFVPQTLFCKLCKKWHTRDWNLYMWIPFQSICGACDKAGYLSTSV